MGVPGTIGDVRPFAELSSRPDTIVYKAYQQSLDRVVLLKVLRASEGASDALLKRFAESAKLVARVQHANVVAVYDYGEVDGQAYVITEFVEGIDLSALLERGPLPLPLALFVLREVGAGLEAAHRKGVLHRDVKPENVLISEEGAVKLADFGLASLAHDEVDRSEVRGTLCYLSPEQIRGTPADARSDLFSLGATFLEMIVGRRAFPGETASEMMDAVLHFDPTPLLDRSGVPGTVRTVAARLLAKDPVQRYAAAGELLDDLAGLEASGVQQGSESALGRYLRGEGDAADGRTVAEVGPLPPVAAGTSPPIAAADRHVPEGAVNGLVEVRPFPDARPTPDTNRTAPPRRFRRLAVLLVGAAVVAGGAGLYALTVGPNGAQSESDAQYVDAGTALPADQTGVFPQGEVESEPELKSEPVPEEAVPPAVAPGTDVDARARTGSAPADSEVLDAPDTTTIVEAAPVDVTPATLRIAVDPWANVFVDGELLGTERPAYDATLEPGSHRVRLEHPSFPAVERTIELQSGANEQLTVSFWDTVARVSVRADHWAEVEIDGLSAGTLPRLDPFLLSPGQHVVILRNSDLGVEQDTVIHVGAGDELMLRIQLADAR